MDFLFSRPSPFLLYSLPLIILPILFPSPYTTPFLTTFFLLVLLVSIEPLLSYFQPRNSPPLIPHPIPFLGHPINLLLNGSRYISGIAASYPQYPIFALQMGPGKTVVVRDAALAAQVQKQSAERSFYGAILEVTKRLVSFDRKSMDVIMRGITLPLEEKGKEEHGAGAPIGLMKESHAMIEGSLAPGKSLDALISQQTSALARQLSESKFGDAPVSLMAFIKHHFTLSSALTLYGEQNPFVMHPSLIADYWVYEAGMVSILTSPFPWLTARTSWKARERVNAGFAEYVSQKRYDRASPMIQQRVSMNLRYGLGVEMAARSELIMLFAVLGNAVPGAFWTIVNLYSRPELLERVRSEVETNAVVAGADEGKGDKRKKKLIDLGRLKGNCPLLISTTRESLRQISNMSSVRLVTQTHTISAPGASPSSYLLEKGTVVQIASGVMHYDERMWGDDARDFVAERFMFADGDTNIGEGNLKPAASTTALPPSVPSAAYRVFGGGSSLCPGRHFAMSEMFAFVALCVCMFDIENEEGGPVVLPERDDCRIPLSVMKPVVEPRVRMRRREGEWGFVV